MKERERGRKINRRDRPCWAMSEAWKRNDRFVAPSCEIQYGLHGTNRTNCRKVGNARRVPICLQRDILAIHDM